jgi:hypothetical protein
MAGMSDINIKYDLLSPGEAATKPVRISDSPEIKHNIAKAQPKSVYGTGQKPSYTQDGIGSTNDIPDRLKNSFTAGLNERTSFLNITFQQDDTQAENLVDFDATKMDAVGNAEAELATEEVVNEEL